jgi:hypothetical protein
MKLEPIVGRYAHIELEGRQDQTYVFVEEDDEWKQCGVDMAEAPGEDPGMPDDPGMPGDDPGMPGDDPGMPGDDDPGMPGEP